MGLVSRLSWLECIAMRCCSLRGTRWGGVGWGEVDWNIFGIIMAFHLRFEEIANLRLNEFFNSVQKHIPMCRSGLRLFSISTDWTRNENEMKNDCRKRSKYSSRIKMTTLLVLMNLLKWNLRKDVVAGIPTTKCDTKKPSKALYSPIHDTIWHVIRGFEFRTIKYLPFYEHNTELVILIKFNTKECHH